jgi:hypothetical protein
MMRKKLSTLAILGCIGALTASRSNADAVISGSGTWGATAPVTAESAPGDTLSFTFDLPNPIATNPTFQATDFSYLLNGSLVPVSLEAVVFYPVTEAGLFDLVLSDGDIVGAYGADIGSSLTISSGTFAAEFAMNNAPAEGSGTVDVTPEPSSLIPVALALIWMVRRALCAEACPTSFWRRR